MSPSSNETLAENLADAGNGSAAPAPTPWSAPASSFRGKRVVSTRVLSTAECEQRLRSLVADGARLAALYGTLDLNHASECLRCLGDMAAADGLPAGSDERAAAFAAVVAAYVAPDAPYEVGSLRPSTRHKLLGENCLPAHVEAVLLGEAKQQLLADVRVNPLVVSALLEVAP